MAKRLHIQALSQDVVAKNAMVLASPRKVNLVAKMIRGMDVVRAANALKFCKRAVAAEVLKTLASAVANATENHGLNPNLLRVKEAHVGKAVMLRRFRARAKGSGSPIHKKFSHLTVVVCEAEG